MRSGHGPELIASGAERLCRVGDEVPHLFSEMLRLSNAPVHIAIGVRGMAAMIVVETPLAEAETTGVAVDRRQVLRIAHALHGGNCQMSAQRLEDELDAILGADFRAQLFRARSHLGLGA